MCAIRGKIAAGLREKGLQTHSPAAFINRDPFQGQDPPHGGRGVPAGGGHHARSLPDDCLQHHTGDGHPGRGRGVQDLSDRGIRYDTCAESHNHFFLPFMPFLIDVDVDLPGRSRTPGRWRIPGAQAAAHSLRYLPGLQGQGLSPPGGGEKGPEEIPEQKAGESPVGDSPLSRLRT